MSHLRVAAVQLDYLAVARTLSGRGWRLSEPLAPVDPYIEGASDFFLSSLKTQHGLLRHALEAEIRSAESSYISVHTEKLREILNFCYEHKVDVVVFPEYSVPVEALEVLRSFSNKMAVFAGLGYYRRADQSIYEELKLNVQAIAPGNNIAIGLTPTKNFLIVKANPAEGEDIVAGDGPIVESFELPEKGAVTAGVAICLDFIQDKSVFNTHPVEIAIVPALSANTTEFTDQTPRNFVRVFANNSIYGGTYIGVPGVKGGVFVDRNGTVPLDPGVEGIVIVDVDYRKPYPTRPSRTRSTDHRLVARSALVYSGRDSKVGKKLKSTSGVSGSAVEDLHRISNELREDVGIIQERYTLLGQSLEALDEGSENLADDEVLVLGRHCVFSGPILSLYEWKYKHCIEIAEKLKDLQSDVPEVVSAPYGEYEHEARRIAKNVRDDLLAVRHKGPMVENDNQGQLEDQLILFARLGSFGEEVVRSLPRQLTLLRTIADIQDPNLVLRYRLKTVRNTDGILHAVYDVICVTRGRTQSEIEELRQGLGQLIHIAFTGSYTMGFTLDQTSVKEETIGIREAAKWWVEVLPLSDEKGKAKPFIGMADWGLIIDLLRSLDDEAIVELHCVALPPGEPLSDIATPRVFKDEYSIEGSQTAAELFSEMFERETLDPRRLSLRFFVGGSKPLPVAVTNSIGIELGGANGFALSEARAAHEEPVPVSPVVALRIFHPPLGYFYSVSGQSKRGLSVATDESQFSATGILLGKARIRQVRSDEHIDVRLSEADRLRHMYVIGKTGTGKTNFLKAMASQDVQVPGRGVTIIDPHGDLVDHVLREIPVSRLEEVTLIDLTRTAELPVLNPLDLDRQDTTVRDRTIQELIGLLHSRIYHQYTGPRFDEMVRLAFQTMLDEGYSEPASFVEVSRLFMDAGVQDAVKLLLKEPDLKRRWKFEEKVRDGRDYGETIQWLTSKFDDIARDTTLRVVIGGSKRTVDIEKIVQQGGILLVRIPEAVIGKQAADFVGSLIMLQLRMAIIRRREFGKLQHYHFVYVDEFQNFANTDFHTLVAEARKFNIGFTLANQNLEQLREFRTYTGYHEQRLINAIFGNVGSVVVFGVGALDARFLGEQFGVPSEQIMRIGRFQPLAKLLVNGHESSPFTLSTKEAVRLESPRNIEEIERLMKLNCWRDTSEILNEISGRMDRLIAKSREASSEDWHRPTDELKSLLSGLKEDSNVQKTVNKASRSSRKNISKKKAVSPKKKDA